MTILIAPNGKRYDTKEIPFNFDPVFCSSCGERMGWMDTGLGDNPNRLVCEECIAEMQQD